MAFMVGAGMVLKNGSPILRKWRLILLEAAELASDSRRLQQTTSEVQGCR